MNMRLTTPRDIGALKNLRLQMLRKLAGVFQGNCPAPFKAIWKNIFPIKAACMPYRKQTGEPVAIAMLYAYEEMPDEANINGKGAKLLSVYTLSAFRGKGYMERLLLYPLEEAKSTAFRK